MWDFIYTYTPNKLFPNEQSTIVREFYKSSTNPLSLGFTFPVDIVSVEIFYDYRTSELYLQPYEHATDEALTIKPKYILSLLYCS